MYMIYKLYNIHKNVSKYIYINSIYIYIYLPILANTYKTF